jgi:hypothetical protein
VPAYRATPTTVSITTIKDVDGEIVPLIGRRVMRAYELPIAGKENC